MKVKVTAAMDMEWDDLFENARNGGVLAGDRITIRGCDWKILDVRDDGSMLIWQCTGLRHEMPFNRNGSNVYEGSDVQRFLREEFPKEIPTDMLEHVTEEGFFLLSKDDVLKYMPDEKDRIATDDENRTTWWWTSSAHRGSASYTWYVSAAGTVYSNRATYAVRLAPACVIR